MSLSLKSNIVWTFGGNVVYAAAQWGLLVALIKLGSIESAGSYSYAISVCAPVFMFSNLDLRSFQATDSKKVYSVEEYLGLRLVMTLMAGMLVALFIWEYIGSGSGFLMMAVVIIKMVESVSDMIYGTFQKEMRMDMMSKSMIYKGIISIVVSASVLIVTGNSGVSIMAVALCWITFMVAVDIPKSYRLIRFDKPKIGSRSLSIIKASLPLGVAMLLISLATNVPRYMVEEYMGLDQLAVFVSITYFIVAGSTVVSAVGQSSLVPLRSHIDSGNKSDFRKLAAYIVGLSAVIGISGCIISLTLGEYILRLFYNESFVQYKNIFVLTMCVGTLVYVSAILGYILNSFQSFRSHSIVLGVAVLSGALGGLYLVPVHGLSGAVATLGLTMGIRVLGSLAVLTIRMNDHFRNAPLGLAAGARVDA